MHAGGRYLDNIIKVVAMAKAFDSGIGCRVNT